MSLPTQSAPHVARGEAVNIVFPAPDSDEYTTVFVLLGGPAGLVCNPLTGAVHGTVAANASQGPNTIVIAKLLTKHVVVV